MRAHAHLPRHHTAAVVATLALALVACPQTAVDEPLGVDMSTSPDMSAPDQALPADDLGQPDAGDLAPDTAAPALGARLEPVDWGLWPPGEAAPPAVSFTLASADAQTWEGRLVWPAGVWRLVIEDGQRRLVLQSDALTGLGRAGDALVEAAEGGAPQLSAAPEEVLVRLASGKITIQRTGAPDALPWDAAPGARPAVAGDLFDDALYENNTGARDPFEVVTRLMGRLHERGAGPLVVGRRAGVTRYLMIAPGADDEPAPQVRGTFTGWEAAEAATMRKLSGRLWGRFIDVPDGEAQYKLVLNNGAAWFTDPSSRHIRWDGLNPNDVGDFNSVLGEQVTGGRMVWLRGVASPELGNTRDVYVRLPPSYDEMPARRYPALYIHDGNESIVRSQLHEVADVWEQGRAGRGVMMVFVALPSQGVRISEYTMDEAGARGDAYSDFVANTLVARIDAGFRTRAERRGRGVVGASLGGLISYWIGARHADTFEYVAGMSSSFWWRDRFMIGAIAQRGCQDVRYYLDSGASGPSQDGAAETRLMRDKLAELGCAHRHVEQPEATHDWSFWKQRFPGVLDSFEQAFDAAP